VFQYKVYRLPRIRNDHIYAYIPTLEQIIVVPKDDACDIPAYIESDEKLPGNDRAYEFPPCFDVLDLHLLDGCNMACDYCYNCANEYGQRLGISEIESAVNYMSDHSLGESVRVHFMGGEPTLAWSALTHSVDYSRRIFSERGVGVAFSITSNGIWNDKQFKFINDNFQRVTISIDGKKDLHDRYRVDSLGKGTFERVFKTTNLISQNENIELRISATVSSDAVERLSETALFLCESFPNATICVEPLRMDTVIGKACRAKSPDMRRFLMEYLSALKVVRRETGRGNFITSFLNISCGNSSRYCSASGSNFIVTPSGMITACGGSTHKDFPGADIFMYGEISGSKVVFSENKYLNLTRCDCNAVEKCRDCFAKFICRGGCLSRKVHMEDFSHNASEHCDVIREACEVLIWDLADMEEGGEVVI
jgi:uncharacterized protein